MSMKLEHSFTVPAPVERTWAELNDLRSVAECFPGAAISSVEGDEFEGTVKVKLGPIVMVYGGHGQITGRDESAHRLTITAQGKDKRGNGTAGADVVATMQDLGGSTDVRVTTDLNVTGKPAQFGRGVMQDVSDKLLGEFTQCLENKLAGAGAPADAPTQATPTTTSTAGAPGGTSQGSGEALDLGATVLPVVVQTYWKQILGGLVVLLVLRRLLR